MGLSLLLLLTGTNCEPVSLPMYPLRSAVANVFVWGSVYLVPASAAPLTRLCLGEDNLLLIYSDGRARLWDTRTREFWRSMSIEKAEELVQQGGWLEWSVPPELGTGLSCSPFSRTIGHRHESRNILSTSSHDSLDAGAFANRFWEDGHLSLTPAGSAATLLVDISDLLRQFSSSAALAASNVPGLSAKAKLEHARALLSILLTFGVSEGIDGICTESLSIAYHPAAIGLTR